MQDKKKVNTISENFQAIHSSDLRSYLAKVGVLVELENGRYNCFCCDAIITLINFRALTKHNGKLLFACNKEACVARLAGETKE